MSAYLSDLSETLLAHPGMSTYLSDLSDISLGYPDMSAYLSDVTIAFLATYIFLSFAFLITEGGL